MRGEPALFQVTHRIRDVFDQLLPHVVDNFLARDLNIKLLQYVLRVVMADYRIYNKCTSTFDVPHEVQQAKVNFSRLFRQCDVTDCIAQPELGIVRSEMGYYPLSIPARTRSSTIENALKQRDTILQLVNSASPNYCIYISMFGVNESICVPTISLVVPNIADPLIAPLVNRLRSMYTPFDCESYVLRFSNGYAAAAGSAWFSPNVPIGASISVGEPHIKPGAGTLGVYLTVASDDEAIYGLTAGHVARPDANQMTINMFAPATRPFVEARKTAEIAVQRQLKAGRDNAREQAQLDRINTVDRHFGHTVYATQTTNNEFPYRKTDFAIVKVDNSRVADNRIDRIAEFRAEFLFEGDINIKEADNPPRINEKVYKNGARTGLTAGIIIDDSKVKWNPRATEILDPKTPFWETIPWSEAYTILGQRDDSGNFTMFADAGDSGSAVLRLREDDGLVLDAEAVGMVYAILYENEYETYVSFYTPIKDLKDTLFAETGLVLSLAVPQNQRQGDETWSYEVLGHGSSSLGLK